MKFGFKRSLFVTATDNSQQGQQRKEEQTYVQLGPTDTNVFNTNNSKAFYRTLYTDYIRLFRSTEFVHAVTNIQDCSRTKSDEAIFLATEYKFNQNCFSECYPTILNIYIFRTPISRQVQQTKQQIFISTFL